MSPYENVQIGNFLISLGFYLKSMDKPLLASINLTQQTPLDSKGGDVVAALNEQFFILEFKRDKEGIATESTKSKYVALKEASQKNPVLLKVSNKCHLLSYGEENDQHFNFKFFPYLTPPIPPFAINSLEAFIEQIFNRQLGVNYHNFKIYVQQLAAFSTKGSSGTSSSGSSLKPSIEQISGIVVCIDKDDKLSNCVFNSLLELKNLLHMDMKVEKNKEQTMKKNKSQDQGIGPDMN